jgi:hypothetical protein
MAEVQTGDAVRFLDLLLDYFADETGWLRGDLDDGRGRRCLVGAIHYLRRKHQITSRTVESLLQEVLPRGYCHLALFNDGCANIAELRGLIMNARNLAAATAEEPRERGTAWFGRWRLLPGFRRNRVAGGDECATSEATSLAA